MLMQHKTQMGPGLDVKLIRCCSDLYSLGTIWEMIPFFYVKNYRPISLTCATAKVMESIVHEQMMSFLLKNNLISDHQHGFLYRIYIFVAINYHV